MIAVVMTLQVSSTTCQDFRIQRIVNQPGLYFEDKGTVRLYTNEWKLVHYIPLDAIDKKFTMIQLFAKVTLDLCNRDLQPINGGSECRMLQAEFEHRTNDIEKSKDIIKQLVRHEAFENSRRKRGLLNPIGEVAKILFGVLDEADAKFYKQKIDDLERSEKEILELSSSQVTIVRSTLKSINGTLVQLSENEARFTQGLRELTGKIQVFANETDNRLHYVEVMSSLNNHLIQVYRIYAEVRENYELIISAITYASLGTLEPHLITPDKVIEYLRNAHISLEQHSLPVAFNSPDVGSVLMNIADISAVMYENILCYIVKVPLVESERYTVYRLWALPVKSVNITGVYTFLETGKELLLTDTLKKYFARVNNEDLISCKALDSNTKICKQDFNVMSTYDNRDCAFNLMNGATLLPKECKQRVITLENSLWNKLGRNTWLYVIPKREKLTILCQNKEPTDVLLQDVGKLSFNEQCKAYGDIIFIQTQKISVTNVTTKDIVPMLNLEIDCCEEMIRQSKEKENRFRVNIPTVNYVNHFDELLISGHRLDDLKKTHRSRERKVERENICLSLFFPNIYWYI